MDVKDLAFEDYKKGMKYKDIAEKHGVSLSAVKSWATRYWKKKEVATATSKKLQPTKKVATKKKGGQPNNQNAVGNDGGAPVGNANALKHGLFSRYMPQETLEIMDAVAGQKPEDIIWMQIELQFAAIIRAQKIMYVKDEKDESVGTSIQFAWDKQAAFLTAQSKAMSELRGLIKQYNEFADVNDERCKKLELMQLNIDKTKAEVDKLKKEGEEKGKIGLLEFLKND